MKGGNGMKKRILALGLIVCMMLGATGCGSAMKTSEDPEPDPVVRPEPKPEETEEPEKEEEPPEPEVILPAGTNPLTGLPMEPEYETNRPVAVMFNNLKAAQPQLGVSQADIIYEVPAEGGITRMLGVFQTLDGVGTLGTIRSTRAYYLELALGHDALLVHAGGSPEAYKDIPAWGVNNMDGVNGGSDAKIFWRDAQRRKSAGYEHSLLTSGENVLNYLAGGRYRTTLKDGYTYPQTFAEDATPAGGETARQVKVVFSNYKTGLFDYDEESKTYLISQYGGKYVDGNSGEQVGVTNVLILNTSISVISGDSAGRLRVQTTGEGKGTFLCGGKAVEIKWSRPDRNSPFVYTLSDGSPLVLGKGHTYVCIISPKTSSVSIS